MYPTPPHQGQGGTHFLHRSFIEGPGTPPPIFHSKKGWHGFGSGARHARLTVTELSGFPGQSQLG